MTALRVAILLALMSPVAGWAQALSEQQLEYLREEFLRNIADSVPGPVIEVGSLPVDRISGTVPASKIVEADPVASAAAAAAQATAAAAALSAANAAAAAAAAQGDVNTQGGAVAAVASRVTALEADAVTWDATKARVDAIDADFPVEQALVFPMVGTTITLYFATGGVLTNAVQEGP